MAYIFLISSLLGILICRLIILKLLKKKNSFIESLCKTTGKFNCDAVLESSFGKFSKVISLGDIGLIYFFAQFLFFIFSLINNASNIIHILLIPVSIAFVTTLVLLWYQWKVIKSWCKLCLLLTSLIWAQASLVLLNYIIINPFKESSYYDELFSDKTISVFFTAIICLLIASTWFLIKPLIVKANEVDNTRKQIARWKNNVNLFSAVVKMQKKIDTQFWEDDFLLGNKDAPIKFIVAMSPYCPACAREYKQLANLLKLFQNEICIAIRFGVNLSKPGIKNQAVQYLDYSYQHTPKDSQTTLLSTWFVSSNLSVLKNKYPDIDLNEIELLKKYEKWFKDADIKHTPTLFIDGYEFPQPYFVADLKNILPELLKKKKLTTLFNE